MVDRNMHREFQGLPRGAANEIRRFGLLAYWWQRRVLFTLLGQDEIGRNASRRRIQRLLRRMRRECRLVMQLRRLATSAAERIPRDPQEIDDIFQQLAAEDRQIEADQNQILAENRLDSHDLEFEENVESQEVDQIFAYLAEEDRVDEANKAEILNAQQRISELAAFHEDMDSNKRE